MALFDLVRVVTSTTGTANVVEGAAVTGFLTFELAGVPTGTVVSYGLQDLDINGAITQSEVGIGTWTTATKTLSRTTVIESTNGGAKISLSGAGGGEIYITALSKDIVSPDGWKQVFWASPTRTSATVFTVAEDVTATLKQYDKLQVLDTTTKYFQVVSATFAAGVTTITTIASTDYALVGNPTEIYYSKTENPTSFPNTFNYTAVLTANAGTITSYTLNSSTWMVVGDQIKVDFDITITNIGTATGNARVSMPVTTTSPTSIIGQGRETVATGNMLQVVWTNALSYSIVFAYNNTSVLVNTYRIQGSVMASF